MSNDPFRFDETNEPVPKYSEHTIVEVDKGTWQQYDICLTPIEPDKPIKTHNKRSFLPDWKKVSKPSLKVIFAKITDTQERNTFMNRVFNEQTYIKHYWEEVREYDKKVIAKQKNDGYGDSLDIDEKGREHIKYFGIHYLAIWFDEAEWRKDAENTELVQETQPISAVEANKTDENAQILEALPVIIKSMKTDMTKLKDTLAHKQFAAYPIDSPEIRNIIIKIVNDETKNDIAQKVIMLAEINSHFDETTYLELDDLTDTKPLSEDEIPF